MSDREPSYWITKGGKHIPIFDDPTADERKKRIKSSQTAKINLTQPSKNLSAKKETHTT